MKITLKLAFISWGFILALISTSNSVFANKNAGGRCEGDITHTCKVTDGGTTVYGYWCENTAD